VWSPITQATPVPCLLAIADSRLPALVRLLVRPAAARRLRRYGYRRPVRADLHPGRPTGTFPCPAEIQPNVDFWRNVYAKWGRNQVALHDDEYLGVIYEVINSRGQSGRLHAEPEGHHRGASRDP